MRLLMHLRLLLSRQQEVILGTKERYVVGIGTGRSEDVICFPVFNKLSVKKV
jgi:hypothetical protein